ncbi:hypothetical protein ACET3Z_000952 [Daucus carota]
MAFIEHDAVSDLNDSRYDWTICVRAQSIWQGINMHKKEFRGLNVMFIDDGNHRIHAFVAATLCDKFKSILQEGSIYEISNFSVKFYHGDETYRAVKNEKHIYFNNDTTCFSLDHTDLKIQPLSFDFHCLDDVQALKKDNRFLIDVVGVLDGQPVMSKYNKDGVDGSIVKFAVTDGKCYTTVSFFNAFGDTLLNALEQKLQKPVIIIIASAKISEYLDEVGLTNYPATRFYLNTKHHVVESIRRRLADSSFYVTNTIEEDVKEDPLLTVKEIRGLKDDYIQANLELVEKRFKCPKCGKFKPYPDRRYEFCMLCSDKTGSIPVLWSAEELTRFTGKTIYDVLADETQVGDGDKFPPMLQQFEKNSYTFTLYVSKENVIQGSNVYTAVKVSDAQEISDNHTPAEKCQPEIKQTEISQDTNILKSSSPPTGESSNKTRARKTTETVELQLPQKTPQRKVKHIKMETNVRMQAFVPTFLMEKLLKMFIVGKMYTITNFQVKEYTTLDKWRCVSTDKQIMFTNQTRAREIDDREYFIPQNCFEFCDLGDVKTFATQSTYLADVVGVIVRRDDLKIVHTKDGPDKPQMRMTISDGTNYLNVTLWNDLAECFQQEISSTKFEEPMILIIAAGKVGVFQGMFILYMISKVSTHMLYEFDICNFSPTTYYINYNHHSVTELRKVSGQQQFQMQPGRIVQTKKEPKLMTVQEIKHLGEDYIEEEVICQIEITTVKDSEPWFYLECTSCYKQVDEVEGLYRCNKCNNRIIPYPDKRFGILMLGKDKTGEIEVLLMDRPARKLTQKTVFELEAEVKGEFPSQFKTMEKGEYTMKLQIREFNINEKEEVYLATDIYKGFSNPPDMRLLNYSAQQATETSFAQSEGNSIHLDTLGN